VLVRSLRPALIAGLLALSPGAARAQDAQALFDQGLEDMRAGRYKIGCALIKRSLEIDARPGTAFTLAECYSKAGKYASAVELYDRYLALYAALSPEQQAQQQARADISATERTRLVGLVAWLTVNLPRTASAGVVVTLDGEPFSLFGTATAVDPGPHVFTTRAPDGPLIEQRIDVATGDRRMVVLQVRGANGPEPPPDVSSGYVEGPAPDDGEEHRSSGGVTPWVYVTGGIGAAGLITGAVTGLIALDRKSVMERECDLDTNVCSQKGLDAQKLISGTLTPINAAGWAVGGAGVVATVLILALDGGSGEEASGWQPRVNVAREGAYVGVFSPF
jgi:hypothetical protein